MKDGPKSHDKVSVPENKLLRSSLFKHGAISRHLVLGSRLRRLMANLNYDCILCVRCIPTSKFK